MKYVYRLMCRLFGHKEPQVAIDGQKHLLIFCPRCLLVHCGDLKTFNRPGARHAESNAD